MSNVTKPLATEVTGLIRYWTGLFNETPLCKESGCARVATEVDAFFPYIDDYNRCDRHQGDMEPGTIH